MSNEKNETPQKNKYIKSYLEKSAKRINDNGNPTYGTLGTAANIGLHMVSGPIVGTFLGYLFDEYVFNSYPYGTIIGFILGIFAGFLNVHKDAKRIQEKQDEMNNNQKK